MEYYIERLLTFIRSHGVDCAYHDNKLMVEDVYTKVDEEGVYSEWIEIQPNGRAVREFLNY